MPFGRKELDNLILGKIQRKPQVPNVAQTLKELGKIIVNRPPGAKW